MITTNTNWVSTSFHNCYVTASVNEIIAALNIDPERFSRFEADGKVSIEWNLRLDNKIPFDIYDWKEPRFSDKTIIEFHIGTRTLDESLAVVEALQEMGLNAEYKAWPWDNNM